MIAEIHKSIANGSVIAPPSKSMAHRLLICAALSGGISTIKNVDFSQDISATVDCLKALGAKVDIFDDYVKVCGTDFTKTDDVIVASCRESGSTLRFLIPIMLLSGKKCKLTGNEYLFTRPLSVYEDICKQCGIYFEKGNNYIYLDGKLKSGVYSIPGNISSQFISGLLFALPKLSGSSKIIITGNFESRSYIDLTVEALKIFGIDIEFSDNEIFINGNQNYNACDAAVEGDFSNAAFFEAFNSLGGNVKINGLNFKSLQGDKVFFDYFKKLENTMPILDISDCPDLGPILFVLAAYHNGAVFTGTARLSMKECDRGVAMKTELEKFGAKLLINDNSITVVKSSLHKPNEILKGYNDHRIVMALSVLLSKFGGVIDGIQAVSKSFPNFFEKIASVGVEVNLYED